ncbi:hypothetical protein BBP40_002299 [Aspergillus hancockii]|nr:hypothetical protein BBP40_002299 [Aspergillus hancockii]
MAFVQTLLSDQGIPLKNRENALRRAFADPGIPIPVRDSTSAYWLKDPHPQLATIQSSEFPKEADIVIIGSGITGTSVARTLLEESGRSITINPKIVMLEARDTCTGATGRNGGHILETAEEFAEWEATYGLETAKAVMRFRLAHLKEILKVAEEYDLTEETQARKVQFLSVHFDNERWRETKRCIDRFKEAMPEESADWQLIEKGEIPQALCLPHARGIVTGPAGALWPYKLVTGILGQLQAKYPGCFQIETNTPVTTISTHSSSPLRFVLHTPNGVLRARHVIHCTNAHVGHLVPELRGRIYPIRGQMSSQNPGNKFISQAAEHSWIFNYNRGFDYLTQLPPDSQSAGKMMFGGGFAQGGIADLGISTDSELSLYCDIHLSGALSAVFGRQNWGHVPGSDTMMWTGNMGFSADGLPWVGRWPLDGGSNEELTKEGGAQWICCGFSGEGMVNAWLCGKAVARMVSMHDRGLSRSDELSWFPKRMLVTEERIRSSVLPRNVTDKPPHQ